MTYRRLRNDVKVEFFTLKYLCKILSSSKIGSCRSRDLLAGVTQLESYWQELHTSVSSPSININVGFLVSGCLIAPSYAILTK